MRLKNIIRVMAAILMLCIAAISVICLDATMLVKKMAIASLVAAAPDGIHGYFNSVISSDESEIKDTEESQQVIESVKTEASVESQQSKSNAVEEKVMGSIIKKTLSPYGANTKYSSVYISNRCGESIDIVSDLTTELEFKVEKSTEPQILIYHTHATESYMTDESQYYTDFDEPRSTDTEKNIVKVGEVIAERLTKAGYTVVHDKTLHDHPGFSGSYSRSAETVNKYLEKYPTIKIAIDVHRDSISSGKSDKIAPVVTVDNKEAAQVMLVMGSETGSIENHPEWRQNLRLATKLQYVFETSYPQFARPILLKSAKYNQNLTTGSILIEVGSDANTFEQAMYSAELVGDSLVLLLGLQ